MKCVICRHGETSPGTATVTVEQGGVTLVMRHVPADVCEVCGEEYVSESTTRMILETVASLDRDGVRFEVRDFAA